VREVLEQFANRFFEQVGEMVGSGRPIGDDARKRCIALGRELARKIK